MTMPVYPSGMYIDDNGNLVLDADEMDAAGVRSVELVEVEPDYVEVTANDVVTMANRIEELEARLKEATSILSDMHSDEGCQFKGARGKDVGCLACLAQAALSPAEQADDAEGVKG